MISSISDCKNHVSAPVKLYVLNAASVLRQLGGVAMVEAWDRYGVGVQLGAK